MLLFEPKYETYQDVKQTLSTWGIPVWVSAILVFFYLLVQPSDRAALLAWSSSLVPRWVSQLGTPVLLLLAAYLASHLLTHVLEAHDRLYDRYLVGWRRHYDDEVILPALLRPFECESQSAVCDVAKRDPKRFMEAAFYTFVGDRDTKIRRNLVVKFYERITKYWLTQIIEMALLALGVLFLLYAIAAELASLRYPSFAPLSLSRYLSGVLAIAAVFLLARVMARVTLRSVRAATLDEIRDIHENHMPALRDTVMRLLDNG